MLDKHDIDTILMDVMMPIMDGFEATKIIKSSERFCDIPLVIVSAASDKNSIKTGLAAGANDFLTKPYDIDELKIRVKNMLRLKQKTDALKQLNATLKSMVEEEVSRRMKLEQQREQQLSALVQQTKMAELGTLLGAIAHQWMQPLTLISLIGELLPNDIKNGKLDEAALQKHACDIMEQVKFMAQTMSDFRNFHKPSAQKSSFSVLQQTSAILTLLSRQLSQSGIIVLVNGDEELCCMGYPNEFKQVVLNIINNAREAFEERGMENRVIKIEVARQERMIVLSIADNAGGIPQELLESVFEPFVSTKGENGTGIGLSLGKTIIEEKMQGKLSVCNTDEGARFEIKLPLYTP